MDTYIQNKGMTKTLIHKNGHNEISKIGWDADYDGNVANIDLDINNNGKNGQLHFELNNNDLEQLLSIPSVNQPLHNRLTSDFKKKKSPLFIIVEEPGSKIKMVEPFASDLSSSIANTSISDNSNNSDNKYTHISSPLPMEQLILPLDIKKGKRKTVRIRFPSLHKSSSRKRSRRNKSSRRHRKYSHSSTSKRAI